MKSDSRNEKPCGESPNRSKPQVKRTASAIVGRSTIPTRSEMKDISGSEEAPKSSIRNKHFSSDSGRNESSESQKQSCSLSLKENAEAPSLQRVLAKTNTAFDSSRCPVDSIAIKASSMTLTECGETYFSNMVAALETGKLDVDTFSTILPYICVDIDAPTDDRIDQGEITLLCHDLLKKAVVMLSKKREVFEADEDEDSRVWERLGLIIEALEKSSRF